MTKKQLKEWHKEHESLVIPDDELDFAFELASQEDAGEIKYGFHINHGVKNE